MTDLKRFWQHVLVHLHMEATMFPMQSVHWLQFGWYGLKARCLKLVVRLHQFYCSVVSGFLLDFGCMVDTWSKLWAKIWQVMELHGFFSISYIFSAHTITWLRHWLGISFHGSCGIFARSSSFNNPLQGFIWINYYSWTNKWPFYRLVRW